MTSSFPRERLSTLLVLQTSITLCMKIPRALTSAASQMRQAQSCVRLISRSDSAGTLASAHFWRVSRCRRRFGLWSSERGRDKANALRSIEGLSQNDQILYLLREQAGMMYDQTQVLRYLAETLHEINCKLPPLSNRDT